MYSTEILLITATIREVNLTDIDSNFTERETQDYAPLRQATNNQKTLTTSKHSIEFTYSDFPCHFKVKTNKLALTNRRWMRKKGKRLHHFKRAHFFPLWLPAKTKGTRTYLRLPAIGKHTLNWRKWRRSSRNGASAKCTISRLSTFFLCGFRRKRTAPGLS